MSWMLRVLLCLLLGTQLPAAPTAAIPGFVESPWPGEATFRSYGPDDELMSMGITGLAQDKAGFLWVATDLGLFWFDGHRFHNLGAQEGLEISPDTRLWADPRGGLWASTATGVFRVEGFRARKVSGTLGLPTQVCFGMDWDEAGLAWMSMGDVGVFRETANGSFVAVPSELEPFLVARASGHGGMFLMDIRGRGGVWSHDHLSGQCALKEDGATEVVSCLEDAEGRLWVLTRRGLWFKRASDPAFTPFAHPAVTSGGDLRTLRPDGSGGLWVATVHGLLNIRGRSWTHVSSQQGMPTHSAALVLVDREGSLWYASNGLFRQLGLGAWHAQTTRDGLPTEIVWSLCRDRQGRLWAGTNLGLALQEGGRWHSVPGSEKTAIFSLVALKDGGVLAAGRPRVLLHVPPGGRRATPLPAPMKVDSVNSQVFRLLQDAKGDPWVLTAERICHLVLQQGRLVPAEEVAPPDFSYLINTFCSLATEDGAFWFATRNGLSRYHQGRWSRWTANDGLLANGLYGVASDRDGSLLVSYYESLGVSRLRVEGDSLRLLYTYRKEQGELPSNAVFSIHRDQAERIWLLTDVGAVAFDPKGYRSFGVGYGLLSQDMVQNGFLSEQDGSLWFANAAGLARFDAARFPWAKEAPAPILVDLQFGGRRVPIGGEQALQVQARDNAMDASLGFLSFAQARNFFYEVRIEGYDTAWRKESLNRLRYLALPAGSYVLRVHAVVDGRPGLELTQGFQVLPRWYATIWAWLLYLAGGGSAIWAYLHRRTIHLQRAKARLESLVRERTIALEASNSELVKSISEIKTLRGLIPICAECKKIRVAQGDWAQLEAYISEKTEATFSHGYCPECAERVRSEFRNSNKV